MFPSCAPPATAVMSAATYNLVWGYFTCQALDEYLSTGGDAPLGLYCVLAWEREQTREEKLHKLEVALA